MSYKRYKEKMRTKNKRNYLKQNGITLIALVVTIVVLLILAGVSLNAIFSENGIIKRAQDAQNKMDQAAKNDLNAINGFNQWTDKQLGKLPNTSDTTPYYPDDTFTKMDRTNLDNGLVIQDANENEYVWIEVPKSLYDNEKYNTETTTGDQKPANSEDYNKIEYCLHKYTEYYRTNFEDTYYSDDTTGLTEIQYTELKQKMLKSVYENGGFWIGRYEAGIETNRTASGDATELPLSKAGTVENPIYPYTYVTCSQAQTLASRLSTGKNYSSSLMFGVQWDLVLKHIEEKEVTKGIELANIQNELKSDSTAWGNYRDACFLINRGKYEDIVDFKESTVWTPYNQTTSNNFVNSSTKQVQSGNNGILLTTGASDICRKMNIYDLAGNVFEWTLECNNGGNNGGWPCTTRGGYYISSGISSSAAYRVNNYTDFYNTHIGFRISLYK